MSVLVLIYCFLCSGRARPFKCRGDRRTPDRSVAVTHTAASFLDVTGTPHDGFMVAASP